MPTPTIHVDDLGPVPGHEGAPAQRWWLEHDGVTVAVGTFGARLLEVHVPDATGHVEDVVAGPKGLAGHEPDGPWPFAGATVGRYANRLGGAMLTIDGVPHDLVPNEGGNQLHGGPEGFAFLPWMARDNSDEDGPAVELALVSAGGDQGFPGTLHASVTYRLHAAGRLEVTYRATTDAPTVVNMTNHAYWDLSGAGGPIAGRAGAHVLRVTADRYVVVDDASLPTAVADVAGTRFDLRTATLLADVLAAGEVDHCMLLGGGDGLAAVLTHPGAGRSMALTTDQPGLQVYLGRLLAVPHGALALEPEVPPDAPNRPDLPLGPERGVLRPGTEYVHRTTYMFTAAPTTDDGS